jgi:hypothetical protein
MTHLNRPVPTTVFTRTRLALGQLALATFAVWILSACGILAETWSDNTGKFKVEAQFMGLQGDKVVLKKANGSVIQVPFARLDKSSQDLAKRLPPRQ